MLLLLRKRYLLLYLIYLLVLMLVTLSLFEWHTNGFLRRNYVLDKFAMKMPVIDPELLTKLMATLVTYPSKKAECDDYGLNFSLYPSLYGFDACETYEFNTFDSPARRGIVCKSSGEIDIAVFTKNAKGEQIECFINRNSTKFECYSRTDNYAVCGCTVNCSSSSNSILSNLPITDYKPSRKVMSFSVYGSSVDYACGVLRQIRLAKVFFPDWTSRVYLNSSVPANVREMLKRETQVIEIPKKSQFGDSGMFWRFMVADDKDVDVYCIRDSDSVFTQREAIAIKKWIASGKGYNLMRDHEYHNTHIVGCCWCGQKRIKDINQKMLDWSNRDKFGDDQDFLNSIIWPIIEKDVLIFESCKSRRHGDDIIPFPTERIACEFTGIAHRVGFYMWNYYKYLCYEYDAEYDI